MLARQQPSPNAIQKCCLRVALTRCYGRLALTQLKLVAKSGPHAVEPEPLGAPGVGVMRGDTILPRQDGTR